MNPSIKQTADTIIQALKAEGIIIQYYESITSKSVYLKLDYGVLKSLRISDHNGKKHLKYRYNIQTNIQRSRYDREQKRFYYPMSDVNRLIEQILKDRNDKTTRYGQAKYNEFMFQNHKDNRSKNGFWKDSVVI